MTKPVVAIRIDGSGKIQYKSVTECAKHFISKRKVVHFINSGEVYCGYKLIWA